MTRVSPFGSPLLLGFDRLEEMVDRLSRSATDGNPPYNVVHLGDERLRISLAVAGFDEDDLDVTVERNQLHIRGRQAEDNGAVYLYRGIAARQFHRTFVLADGIEIEGACLDNGLLHIELTRPATPEIVRTVAIKSGDEAGAAER
jgi:HSP20 family molecular chaperone IbpA